MTGKSVWSVGKCVDSSVYNLHGFNGKTLILCCTILTEHILSIECTEVVNIFFDEQYLIIRLKMYVYMRTWQV